MANKYGIWVANWSFEGWIRDSVTESLDELKEFIKKNNHKLERIDDTYMVLHYPEKHGVTLADLKLTKEEYNYLYQ